jgi:CheY-like chemotaxis protein
VPYTLLLADDSVTIQRVIELTFADEDVTVVAVSDGDQAIERLEAAPPDIVLADIGMPGKNGYEVAQYMRRSPKLAHIPVVLLTGAFEPVDQARANDAGCDGVLAKPFEPQLVIGRVKELLAKARRAADVPRDVNQAGGDAAAVRTPAQSTPTSTPAADSIWAPPANQRPVTPFVDPPAATAPAGAAVPRTELNDYFDRLDAAFSTLSSAPAASPAHVPPIADPPAAPAEPAIDWFATNAPETGTGEVWDLPSGPASDAPVDLPLSYAAADSQTARLDEPALEPPLEIPDDRLSAIEESVPVESVPAWPEPVAAVPAPVHEPAAPFAPPATLLPPAPTPPTAPALALPLPHPPPLPSLPDAFAALLAAEQGETPSEASALWPADAAPAPAPLFTDDLIEEIVRRVLARLSDTVVRDAIADVASQVAERLVLEEIARIRASIK